jgi:hypothetical protein
MKTVIRNSLKKLISDRYLLALIILLILLAVAFAITIGLSIHLVDQRMVSHYSAFGITHIYFDQPLYLFTFVLFELIVAAMHSVLAVKLLLTKGRSLAIICAWFGIGIVLMGWITAFAVLNLGKSI